MDTLSLQQILDAFGISVDVQTAVSTFLANINQDDVNGIANSDYKAHTDRYTGANGQKTLADDTFDDEKHFLRGKVGAEVDVAWGFEDIRGPLREYANNAAAAVFAALSGASGASAVTPAAPVTAAAAEAPAE